MIESTIQQQQQQQQQQQESEENADLNCCVRPHVSPVCVRSHCELKSFSTCFDMSIANNCLSGDNSDHHPPHTKMPELIYMHRSMIILHMLVRRILNLLGSTIRLYLTVGLYRFSSRSHNEYF